PPGYVPPVRPRGLPVRRVGGPRPVTGPHQGNLIAADRNLITVDRGPQFSAPFHFQNGVRPEPRPLTFDGRSIQPIEAGIHPLQRGPMGEGFTTALVRSHPEMGPAVGLRSTPGVSLRNGYTPAIVGGRTFGAPPTFSAPRAGGYSGGAVSHGSFSSGSSGASHAGSFSSGGASSGGGHVSGGSVSSGGAASSAGASSGGAHH
ncbi:MAG: hypothetical protein WA476_00345, partial [Acidobacteriaceae bacterium]